MEPRTGFNPTENNRAGNFEPRGQEFEHGLTEEKEMTFNDEMLRSQLEEMTEDEFRRFLTDFNFETHQFDLSQETVDMLFRRYINLAHRVAIRKKHTDISQGRVISAEQRYLEDEEFLFEFYTSGMHITPRFRPDLSRQNLTDKILTSAVKGIKQGGEHLEPIAAYLSTDLFQSPQMIGGTPFYDQMKETLWLAQLNYSQWDAGIVEKIKHDFISAANYNLSFGGWEHFYLFSIRDERRFSLS